MGELTRRVDAALQALRTAQVLMEGSGAWRNGAGYMTDAALWIERAQRELAADLRGPRAMSEKGELSATLARVLTRR